MPAHCRMRAFDRDLIRGGHYGQRSCEPLLQAEHMAAPDVKISLANPEPSTHGTTRTSCDVRFEFVQRTRADIGLGFCGPAPLAANRLQQHCVPVKIKETALAAGEYAHVDGVCGVDAHPLKRRMMSHG